jgi:aldehyde dehydrogenase (NAD+)
MQDMTSPAADFAALAAGTDRRRQSFGLTERRAALSALERVLRANRAGIGAAVRADLGRPEAETDLVELLPVLSEIGHTRRSLRRWMRPRRAAPTLAMLGTVARVVPEAKGVVLILAPWNFPLMLCLAPLVSALAAGNAAVVKPSELTPATAELLARLVAEALPADLVRVVLGGVEVAQALLEQPFDHIFFTGSPAVGRKVMQAAARHLTPVTLELGGKSPVIVGTDADLAQAARWIVWGKVMNAGQVCVGPDHVFVHASRMADLRAALVAEVARQGVVMPRIANARHHARLVALAQDARAKGATVTPLGAEDPAGLRLPVTLIEGQGPAMAVATEEIFGPLLPLIPYDDPLQVVAQITAAPKPLALYIFARDRGLVDLVTSRTSSGSVGVNLTVMTFSHGNLPFGGVGNSGMGAAHGRAGFETFSHLKPVLRNWASPLPLVFPPYGARVRRMIGAMVRWL